MGTLLVFAFLSGVVTIAAPCIWPILPIVLSASAAGGRFRPVGIVTGLVLSFTALTLLLASVIRVLPIDPEAFRILAVVVIGALGVSLAVPAVGRQLEGAVSRLSGRMGTMPSRQGQGFWGGFVAGAALGVVWSPCAGPILAAVATLAATQAVTLSAAFVTFSFGAGVAIPLFLFATLGQRLFTANRFLRAYTGRIQQGFGIVMILSALAIYSGYDKLLQTAVLDRFPGYGQFLNRFEDRPEVERSLEGLRGSSGIGMESGKEAAPASGRQSSLPVFGPAPEFATGSRWINTDRPLTLADLRGKVVLVDFWTYSCINCIRTLPYVTGWYGKYKDDGFVVVGVHTPEFAFEHKTENVVDALKRYGIKYPVVQDNDYGTWQAYRNRYWPAHYLIDAEGNVRYAHFGEGEYDKTERAIRDLLAEAGQDVSAQMVGVGTAGTDWASYSQTPETYLGYGRMDRFASPELVARDQARSYTFPETLKADRIAYDGTWTVESERIVSGEGARLRLRFTGKKVFLVLAPPPGGSGRIMVTVDGASLADTQSGVDVREGLVTVDTDRLYELYGGQSAGDHVLELWFETPGTAAYAFTFG